MWSPASPDTALQTVSLQAPCLIFHQTPPASIPHTTLPACFQHWKLVPFTPFTGPPAGWVAATSHAGGRRSPLGHSEAMGSSESCYKARDPRKGQRAVKEGAQALLASGQCGPRHTLGLARRSPGQNPGTTRRGYQCYSSWAVIRLCYSR